jgi:VIT1/CCC1 family predicted Fe2+/Mn2+ transporter
MAQSEERHQALWRQKIEEAGGTVPEMKASGRIRVIGWIARRFGPGAVAPLVARMEQSAFTMYDNQPEAVEGGLPGDERTHALISRELARSDFRAGDIVRIEGRHIAGSGNALRAAVLGANDGLVSNLCLVMGIAGADPGRSVVLLTGFGGLLAGAISMGLGEWVSVRSSAEAFERQVSIEREELLLMPEEEADELALIYEAKGLSAAEARSMARRIVANPESALDTLTREELGMSSEEVGNPWTAASTSFILFAVGALLPILPWLFVGGILGVALSAIFSGVGLFALGAVTSLFTGRSSVFSGGRMLVFGLIAAAITFTVGMVIGGAAGV